MTWLRKILEFIGRKPACNKMHLEHLQEIRECIERIYAEKKA